jgi:MFS family permease
MFLTRFGFKGTLAIGAASWFVMYILYVVGKPKALLIVAQPLHGLAYVFFMIVGQIFAESVAPEAIRSSMQALIFAATTGIGLFIGTHFAGIVMDRSSVEGRFQWSKVWIVPCVITAIGLLVLLTLFRNPPAAQANEPPAESVAHVMQE